MIHLFRIHGSSTGPTKTTATTVENEWRANTKINSNELIFRFFFPLPSFSIESEIKYNSLNSIESIHTRNRWKLNSYFDCYCVCVRCYLLLSIWFDVPTDNFMKIIYCYYKIITFISDFAENNSIFICFFNAEMNCGPSHIVVVRSQFFIAHYVPLTWFIDSKPKLSSPLKWSRPTEIRSDVIGHHSRINGRTIAARRWRNKH